jgi:Uma2 family endonuclease
MSTAPRRRLSIAELALERQGGPKHEYFAGEVFAMSGASEAHNLIVANLLREIGTQLKEGPCRVYPSDMRVKVSSTGLYTYPDVSIVCGPSEFDDERRDTLVNPQVVIEVLSESTEAYDRGRKFAHYRTLDSFVEYILVSQDRRLIEQFCRSDDGRWILTAVSDPDGVVELSAAPVRLLVRDVYHRVDVEADS